MMPLNRLAAAVLMLGWLACGIAAEIDGYTQAAELHQQGDDAAALVRLDAFLAEHPRDSRARFLKGVILARQNRTQEAIDVLTALSEEFPELPEPHNNLAALYASQGKYDNARRELEMAVRANPDYAIAYQNLGDVYAALAAQAYEKALHADAKNATARTRLEQVRKLLPEGAVAAAPPPTQPSIASSAAAGPPPAPDSSAPGQSSAPAQARPAPGVPPTTAAAPPADVTRAVLTTIEEWAKAWSAGAVEKYLSFYAQDFRTPKGEARGNWEADRRKQLTTPRIIVVEVVDPKVTFPDHNHCAVVFKQNYRADAYRSSGRKTLQLVREGDRWLIQQETIKFR